MAVTIKRLMPEFTDNTKNNAQHFNQMTFKGIVQNNNPFDVDQLSLKDALNVFVDDNGTLVSRPPIMREDLPIAYLDESDINIVTDIVPDNYQLVDMYETGKVTIYISEYQDNYYIVIYEKDSSIIKIAPSLVTKYHVTSIENYIIVFNDVDALVLNVNRFRDGWSLLREMSDIPITKRIIGQETYTFPKNQFTNSYKEEYIWSENIESMLPNGTAKVTINHPPDNIKLTLPNGNINTEFRLMRPLNITLFPTDIISAAVNNTTGIEVICVARHDHVMVSFDYGESFRRFLYPANDGFRQIASISNDATHFFFVAQDGVYRLNLGIDLTESEWTAIRLSTLYSDKSLKGMGVNNICNFLSAEIFSFVMTYEEASQIKTDIYFMGEGLKAANYERDKLSKLSFIDTINPNIQLNKTARDLAKYAITINVNTEDPDNLVTSIGAWLPGLTLNTSVFVSIVGDTSNELVYSSQLIYKGYGMILSSDTTKGYGPIHDTVSTVTSVGYKVYGITSVGSDWTEIELTAITKTDSSDSSVTDEVTIDEIKGLNLSISNEGAPIDLSTAYMLDLTIKSVDGTTALPDEMLNKSRRLTIAVDRNYYMILDNKLYSNYMIDWSQVSLLYDYISTSPYVEIPTLSYTSNELYLAFGNILKITANERTGIDITFNLPEINDHAFASDVTGMISISTEYIAIYLINQIFVTTRVFDELFGYRYEYYNTRLTTGVRLGDTVMNTRDGQFTLYPTRQGLAVMNYQMDTANTDQIVDYVSKDIIQLWTDFYFESGPIEMIQMRDYVFITNNTKRYLILDLRGLSWWVMESPVEILKMTTDQVNISIISNGLYKYNLEPGIYRDLGVRDIYWRVESQPNHFKAPNHYKNMRQLIFQLEESTENKQTIVAQIRLFRKSMTLREPEVIEFGVQSYRTFIKRFNYWKINELQWALAADNETETPAQLKLNGIAVKYEISDEVRS